MNPFIPKYMADVVIVDRRIDEEIENNLKKLGLKIIKTIKCNEVHESISYHPDIVIHPLNHNTLVIAPNVFDYYKEELKGTGIKLIKGEKYLGCKYPDDIAYNVGRLSRIAIHNFKYTDNVLKFYLKKENIEFINVKQGYSKCSLAVVGEDSAITSDYPMYKRLTDLGYKILLVNPGNIILKDQNYGFIGGTNGSLYNKKSIISGTLNEHPNKTEIFNFFLDNRVELIFLSQKTLLDIGTIITLNYH
ncbi:hypothetical protein KQI41_13100 [Tissierella pigra]|uniref:DUF6873 domain-containing protein n=1 Tax=Tissierella pigra TaxID=2607614 RepID=A0A6N7XVE3_9FIRM|nr:hypothetical protein [Tissierella pigra]MBU5427325.1 hypothetical protein [Tissierella pigra]MSU01423.1 hypothetical protein [Tissierella pigra]